MQNAQKRPRKTNLAVFATRVVSGSVAGRRSRNFSAAKLETSVACRRIPNAEGAPLDALMQSIQRRLAGDVLFAVGLR